MFRKNPEDIRSMWGYAGYVLFSFSGRINGRTFSIAFFYGLLGLFVYFIVASFLYHSYQMESLRDELGSVILLLWGWSILALSTKRLHDSNRLGLAIIPGLIGPYLLFIGTIWWIYLLWRPSDTYTNMYGPPPLSWKEIAWKLDSDNRRRKKLEQEALENEERGNFDVAIRIWKGLGEGGKVEELSRLRAEILYDDLKEKIDTLKAQGANCTQLEEQVAVIETALEESATSKSSIGTESEE